MSLMQQAKKLSKYIRGKLEEREFDKTVERILSDDAFDKKTNIFRFTRGGREIRVKIPDVRDHISFEICRSQNFFGHENLNDLKQFIRPGSVIIDAGANIGNHSLYFALICKASEIHAFEPQKDIFEILTENIRLNGCNEIIIPHKIALGDKAGHASINFREDLELSAGRKILNTGGVFIKEDQAGDFELSTLDEYMTDRLSSLDFMKIDVQGFEEKLLKGGQNLIKKYKPLIYLEVTTISELNEQILPIMNSLGYKLKKAYTIDYLFESYL